MHAKRQSSSETTHVVQETIGHLTLKVFFALSRGRRGTQRALNSVSCLLLHDRVDPDDSGPRLSVTLKQSHYITLGDSTTKEWYRFLFEKRCIMRDYGQCLFGTGLARLLSIALELRRSALRSARGATTFSLNVSLASGPGLLR